MGDTHHVTENFQTDTHEVRWGHFAGTHKPLNNCPPVETARYLQGAQYSHFGYHETVKLAATERANLNSAYLVRRQKRYRLAKTIFLKFSADELDGWLSSRLPKRQLDFNHVTNITSFLELPRSLDWAVE